MEVKATQHVEVSLREDEIRRVALAVVRRISGLTPLTSDGGHYSEDGHLWVQSGRDPRDEQTKVRKLTVKDEIYLQVLNDIRKADLKNL